jgi:AraC-like DNA-binding protein
VLLFYITGIMNYNITTRWLVEELERIIGSEGIEDVYYVNPNSRPLVSANISHVHRLAVPLDGCHRMTTVVEQQQKIIHPVRREMTFMPTGCWNKPDWQLPVCVATFIFKENDTVINVVQTRGGPENKHVTVINSGRPLNQNASFLLNCLATLYDTSTNSLKKKPLVEALLLYCIDDLKQPLVSELSKAHRTCTKIRGYLGEYFNTDIDRKSVAELFNISPNYLSNLFKQYDGISFSHYVTDLRIKHACHLLKTTDMTLDEITMSCGYNDTSYFCNVFKRHIGVTPGCYRA